jgi:hypothetical protein
MMSIPTENGAPRQGLQRTAAFRTHDMEALLRPDTQAEVMVFQMQLVECCMRDDEQEASKLISRQRGTPLLNKFREDHPYDSAIENMLLGASDAEGFRKALSFCRMLEGEGIFSGYSQVCLLVCLQQLGMFTECSSYIQMKGYPWSSLQEAMDKYRAESNMIMLGLVQQLDGYLCQLIQQEQATTGGAAKV